MCSTSHVSALADMQEMQGLGVVACAHGSSCEDAAKAVATCREGLLGTSPQELDSTWTSLLRHQSMHLMACSLLPFPSASMKRHASIFITCSMLALSCLAP